MNSILRLLAVIVCLVAPGISHAQKAEMPAPSAFNVGDSWEWREVDSRTKLEEGTRTRTVVNHGGILKFSYGNGQNNSQTRFGQISAAFIGKPSQKKPWRVWPLEVGKKWVFDADWVRRSDGVTGNTKQDAEVVAYEEVTVPAGKFMAFKIEYRGWSRNSGGGNGKQDDTYWYAPDAMADVKHIRDDGYNMYTQELVSYKHGSP